MEKTDDKKTFGHYCPRCRRFKAVFFLEKGQSTPLCTSCLTPLEYKSMAEAA